jgi:hypothetical protein
MSLESESGRLFRLTAKNASIGLLFAFRFLPASRFPRRVFFRLKAEAAIPESRIPNPE